MTRAVTKSGLDAALVRACAFGYAAAAAELLAEGADPNAASRYDWRFSALMWTAYHARTDCLRLLLAAGADRNLTDRRGRTAQQIAADCGHAEIAAMLADDDGR